MTPSPIPAWPGPLDVGGLAMDAVAHAAEAVRELARARDLDAPRIEVPPRLVEASFSALDHLRVDGRRAEPWAPLSGFFAARDGWVRLHGNYPHHATAISRALGSADRTGIEAAIADRAADDVERRVAGSGGVATVVRTPAAWDAHPHARSSSSVPWCAEERRGTGAGRLRGAATPLDGVRVLDLTRVIAGPTCTQLLGCLGAEVLRIDPPGTPEILDQFLSTGMGKRSAVLDLGHADGARALRALLPHADVVVTGYRPGALTRFGLDADTLLARFPHLVVGSLSAWGETGPWGRRAGFDSIVQAATGIAHAYGSGGAPGALPVQALDHATGYELAAGILRLLGEGRSGIVRANLLGAARALFARDVPRDRGERTADGPPASSWVEAGALTVEIDTPHGHVRTVPVPLVAEGETLRAPIGGYGAAAPRWAPTGS